MCCSVFHGHQERFTREVVRDGVRLLMQEEARKLEWLRHAIARNPRAGRLRQDLGPDIRSFPVLPYVVFYRIKRGRIDVVRILHGHRDIRPPLGSLLAAV